MITVESPSELRSRVSQWRGAGQTVGFVPTMGYLHEGHLALLRESSRLADRTILSIFVNPLQFGPQEDLERYPRDIGRDTMLAEGEGCDLLFLPSVETMYPAGYQTSITVSRLSLGLCGKSRPGHFAGVATVVAKLFNLVQPDIAVFGQKDYQQLALLRQMAKDLNYSIDIIGYPIVREVDGLAMSSRNKYLDESERVSALNLYRVLAAAHKKVAASGSVPTEQLRNEAAAVLERVDGCRIDYIEVVDATTLEPVSDAVPGNVMALAVYMNEKVRLIDNILL